MRKDVQRIFKLTPHDKQVMMFSATMSDEIRAVCKKFMHNVITSFLILHSISVILFQQGLCSVHNARLSPAVTCA